MDKNELIARLKKIKGNSDIEVAHVEADDLLLAYINDSEITAAYAEIEKWYA